MENNIFLQDRKQADLSEYLQYNTEGRENLGDEIPVQIYRMLEYSIRDELIAQFGKEKQIELFRKAGYRAGCFFARNKLDISLPFSKFIAQLQNQLEAMKIGVLRIENYEEETGKMILTVSEDADCSGLPLLGETVCNYDEGFISGVLSTYTGRDYSAQEVDCWATGDRVCRFEAQVKN